MRLRPVNGSGRARRLSAAAPACLAGLILAPAPARALTGACCDAATGACSVTDDDACTGALFFSGATCDPSPCPPPPVACCLPGGDCEPEAPGRCTARGGRGDASGSCSPAECAESNFGSCCIGGSVLESACLITHVQVCNLVGGVFEPGEACQPGACDGGLFQVCCLVNQECIVAPLRLCKAAGGRPLASGVCEFFVCTEAGAGACCLGEPGGPARCEPHGRYVCTSLGGAFRGESVACESPSGSGNPVACCRANVDRAGGVDVGDIFAFLSLYFSGAAGAEFDGVPGIGTGDLFGFLAEYFRGCA